MLSASANASYVSETWHKNTNEALQGIKSGEGKQVLHREPQCFPLCCTGSLQVVQTPPSSAFPSQRDQRRRQSTGGAGQGHTKTFASVNSHGRPDTEQAMHGFLTSHPLTLGSLMDTSGGSLFFISHRLVLRVCFCRSSASLGLPDLDRCKKFSERAGNFHCLTLPKSIQQKTW